MSESKTILIESSYYKDFRCLADACPDTCCQGWNIEIEPETLSLWQTLPAVPETAEHPGCLSPASFISTTENRNGTASHKIRMDEHMRCPMLTADGLCSLVIAHGHEATTRICRDYPRQFNEYEQVKQRTVSVRCAHVLDLLWSQDTFRYQNAEDGQNCDQVSFPSKGLLDGFLSYGNTPELASGDLLITAFEALYKTHKKLEALMPVDSQGLRDYGQEFIDDRNTQETLSFLKPLTVLSQTPSAPDLSVFKELLRTCHDMMYDVMQSFFDNPVFGDSFLDLFLASQTLLAGSVTAEQYQAFLSGSFLPSGMDEKLKLLILEQFFTSVFTLEVLDYESLLVRLQWLIVQYQVVRYILFLDAQSHDSL
ncbi:MAG: flagellin lysine-N-methylase, partial [Clostridiales bacterium]|nr:flagellin lysine-N-methylase [Candidatus Blautia equi]